MKDLCFMTYICGLSRYPFLRWYFLMQVSQSREHSSSVVAKLFCSHSLWHFNDVSTSYRSFPSQPRSWIQKTYLGRSVVLSSQERRPWRHGITILTSSRLPPLQELKSLPLPPLPPLWGGILLKALLFCELERRDWLEKFSFFEYEVSLLRL